MEDITGAKTEKLTVDQFKAMQAQTAIQGSLNRYVGLKNNHNHIPPCEHVEFSHCKQCDVVQCTKCGKEWFQHSIGALTRSHSFGGQNINLC